MTNIRRWLIYAGIVLVCLVVFQSTGILPALEKDLGDAFAGLYALAKLVLTWALVLGLMWVLLLKMVTGRFPWEGGGRRRP